MSKIVITIANLIFKLIARFNKRIKLSERTHLMKILIEPFEKESQTFFTYHLRPMYSESVSPSSLRATDIKKIGIVIQGPIEQNNSFTLETVKIYQKLFRGAAIVLSTWEGEDASIVNRFYELGVEVILNRKPEYTGQSNINLQIVSSSSGVKRAQKLGAEYVMKTRTDQRIYATDIAEFLINLTELFPVRGGYDKQKKRIIGIGLNTFKHRMYGLSDMLIFGHIDDMLLYWDVALDQRVFSEEEIVRANSSLRNFAHWRVCEVYLATEFLMKVGRKLEWSLKDSWGAFADHFCVVDKEQLDLFWPKYNRLEYRWLTYTKEIKAQEMTFREWFNICSNLDNKDIPEEILD